MKKIIVHFLLMVFTFIQSGAGLSVLASVQPVTEVADSVVSDDVFKGRAEVTDRLEKENKELFTGEIDQLEVKDVINMTVSQVLSSGYTEEGDEFFAEISTEVEGDKGVILPAGTIAHGTVKEIQGSKRLGRDGWIEVNFDYLITPDGREIPIQGQMSTKLNPVVGATKTVAKSAGYTVAGGAVGGFLALNMFGLPAAIASQGYILAGGAALGGSVGLGMALYKKGKDVLISPGDVIKVKITKALDLPVFKPEALKQEEFVCDGLNVKITNIDYEEDPFGGYFLAGAALFIKAKHHRNDNEDYADDRQNRYGRAPEDKAPDRRAYDRQLQYKTRQRRRAVLIGRYKTAAGERIADTEKDTIWYYC